MEHISRTDARNLGFKRFFTGVPCKRCHVAERYVSTGSCAVCSHDYFNKWKAKNPEKILAFSRTTTAKNHARRTAERHTNRKKFQERARHWYANNKEQAKNSVKKWQAKNPDQGRIKANNYRARKLNAPGKHRQLDIANLFTIQNGQCVMPWCRTNLRSKYHVDHIISLSAGGSNNPDNLQLLCPTCNRRKSAKDPIQFAQENGFLL